MFYVKLYVHSLVDKLNCGRALIGKCKGQTAIDVNTDGRMSEAWRISEPSERLSNCQGSSSWSFCS